MNKKRFISCLIAVFAFVFAFEWLFHGTCLKEIYTSTAHLWRSEAEMRGPFFTWLVLAQFIFSTMFCYIFVKGYENKGLMEGVRYGFLIGVLLSSLSLMAYAVQPFPSKMIVYWIIGGIVECSIAGLIMAAFYQARKKV